MRLKYDFGDGEVEYEADVDTKVLRSVIAEYAKVDEMNEEVIKLLDFIVHDLDIQSELEECLKEGITEKYYDEAADYYREQKESARAEEENIAQIMRSWH